MKPHTEQLLAINEKDRRQTFDHIKQISSQTVNSLDKTACLEALTELNKAKDGYIQALHAESIILRRALKEAAC